MAEIVGTFLLTNLLIPLMQSSHQPGRIITLTSQIHRLGSLNISDEMNVIEEGLLASYRAYARSKVANILFSLELSKKLKGNYLG